MDDEFNLSQLKMMLVNVMRRNVLLHYFSYHLLLSFYEVNDGCDKLYNLGHHFFNGLLIKDVNELKILQKL